MRKENIGRREDLVAEGTADKTVVAAVGSHAHGFFVKRERGFKNKTIDRSG